MKIEEDSDDSDDTAEALKKLQASKKKTKSIDNETLNAAKAKAVEIDKQ